MKNIKIELTKQLETIFRTLGYPTDNIIVNCSSHPDLADYQCNSAMNYGKKLGLDAKIIAQSIVNELSQLKHIKECSVTGPGFINIRLADAYLCEALHALHNIEHCSIEDNKNCVILDFGGPNIAKIMHVGHLRSAIIGESLQRIFKFCNKKIISDIHLGDWGTPIGMLIRYIKDKYPNTSDISSLNLNPKSISQFYKAAAEQFKTDEDFKIKARLITKQLQQGDFELVKIWEYLKEVSIKDIKEIYKKLNVNFDYWEGESDVRDILPIIEKDLLERGLLVENQGALIIAENINNEDYPPTIFKKQDGGYTYAATDIATIYKRVKAFQPEMILYVVDKRQSEHLKQVFRAVRFANYVNENVILEHIPFGTINDANGKPFKTRSGENFSLIDLLELVFNKVRENSGLILGNIESSQHQIANEIAIAAIKYQDLKNNRLSDYNFDIQQFTDFEGNTGPYLQYAIARINSILSKSNHFKMSSAIKIRTALERDLVMTITRFPESVSNSYRMREPSEISKFAYSLAKMFSKFYNTFHILKEKDEATLQDRLLIVILVKNILEKCLYLLGIDSPEKMLSLIK